MTFTISGRLVRWPSYPRTAVCLKCDLWVTDSYWHKHRRRVGTKRTSRARQQCPRLGRKADLAKLCWDSLLAQKTATRQAHNLH